MPFNYFNFKVETLTWEFKFKQKIFMKITKYEFRIWIFMDEFIEKLKEKYEKGEISKGTYEDILERYKKEKKEEEAESPTTEQQVEKRENEKVRDYKCAGTCTLPAGKYGYISVAGTLDIMGDIMADKISVAGTMHAGGDVKVDSFKGAGSVKIDGDMSGDEISVGGSLNVRNVNADSIKIGGTVSAEKIKGDSVHIGGSVKATLIEGDNVHLKIGGKSTVDVISGDHVEVSGKKSLFKKCSGRLIAKEIHGDTVKIECTTAKLVDCEDAIIGYGCEIESLRAESMKISKNAKIKKKVRK